MRTVQAGQVQLQVLERGRGMPVLLVHGFPLDHSMWDAQIEPLAESCHVIAPDLRGFGGSQVISGTATMEAMADDLAALLDALHVKEPVVFCGLSMGGYVAFQFWRKYAARLRALVLCDTRAAPDTPEAAAGRLTLVEKVLQTGAECVADAMLPKLFASDSLQNFPGAIAAQREVILRTAPAGIAAALRGMATRPDAREYLSKIALPTRIIVGQHDTISIPEEMRGIAEGIRGSEFVVVPQAGHMTPVENPAGFNAALKPFLHRLQQS